MSIAVYQINGTQLTAFVVAAMSGGNFSGIINGYTAGGGYLGTGVVWTTGGTQTISGFKTFATNPFVPYSGGSGTAPSQQWVTDNTLYFINSLSGRMTGGFVNVNDNQYVYDYKIFTGSLGVGYPLYGIDATNLDFISGYSGVQANIINGLSGFLTSLISSATLLGNVRLTGAQVVAGQKTFSTSPVVPVPSISSGAIPLSSLLNASGGITASINTSAFLYQSGNQVISGQKVFTGSPFVPVATQFSGAVQFDQWTGTVRPFDFSFYQRTFATGLYIEEMYICNAVYITGFYFSSRFSGTGPLNGGILTGNVYYVDGFNNETSITGFTYDSGFYETYITGVNFYVPGGNRIGLHITNGMSGVNNFSVGGFGRLQ